MNQLKTLDPEALVPMDIFEGDFALRVEVAYARGDNLLFGERVYREDARLWLHEDLAQVVLLAAVLVHETHGFSCVLYDGLRTVEAQEAMLKTRRVADNPQWLEEPRLLSPPGAGAHPRGMAIDIALEDAGGGLIDMGCAFDFLAQDPSPAHNPAHRAYAHSPQILENREMLDFGMAEAARRLGVALLPLPQEWWDFRLPPESYDIYDPLSDSILPPQMRLMDGAGDSKSGDFDPVHFADKAAMLGQRVRALI